LQPVLRFGVVATGTVKSFNPTKRYGFIQPDSGANAVFFHISQVKESELAKLRKGRRVSFEIAHNEGRQIAEHLLIGPLKANFKIKTDSKHNPTDLQTGTQHTAMKRKVITRDTLQSVIASAVRDSSPQCEAFVGIFIRPIVPKSRGDVNWALRGVKYGSAERAQCDAAISHIVEQLQRQFVISDE
jgi:CspA family cold shock protein